MLNNSRDTGFLLRNLMENMTDNVYFKDRDSRFLMVNNAFREWTGLADDQIVGKTDFDLFASAHAQEAFEDEKRVMASGEPIIGIEEKETWADGRITWVSTTKMPLRDAEGGIIGTFGVSRDITDHKEAELKAAYYAEQVRKIKDAMEDDVRMAAELQKTFFPRVYPVLPAGAAPEDRRVEFLHHYHASGLVSGDFCTVHVLSDVEVGVFLCDVMGHGVRAALVTALICALVDDTAETEKDPGDFLARMNAMLIPILRREDMFLYATASYMVFNSETGVLKHANAGHPVPIHFQSARETATWLMEDADARGPALAITEEGAYQTFETNIAPDDSVVMYTDGLYEVVGRDDEEFGEKRLLEAAARHATLRLDALFPVIINEARHFATEGEFDDDICMIGFKWRGLKGERL